MTKLLLIVCSGEEAKEGRSDVQALPGSTQQAVSVPTCRGRAAGVKGFTPGHLPHSVSPQMPPANGKEDASVEGAVEVSGSCGNRKSSNGWLVMGAAGSVPSVGRAAGEDNKA